MTIDSVCCYCGVGCDILADVKENKIESVSASKDGEVSEGKLCIKGKYGFDFVHSQKRLPKVKIKNSFLQKHELFLPSSLKLKFSNYRIDEKGYIYPKLDEAYELIAWKIKQIKLQFGAYSFASIGGARGNCESSYLFQKFTREVLGSPHIDNCARVCHAPTLKGMRSVIGEGAATNPFRDIYKAEFLLVIGSNTTEGHPIVANKIISALKKGTALGVVDVRDIPLSKFAKYNAIIPFEANLLFLNMMAYVIISKRLYDEEFIKKRSKDFEEYKEMILSDPYANPAFFEKIEGYEYLSTMVEELATEYAKKRSIILWGLGVTEHLDGSYAAAAICNLAVMTSNIGKEGAGLMPLRGQNNVQGTCDMGCLPYYLPDYGQPDIEGKKTPDIIDAVLNGEIKVLFNMGEDIAHIHPNQHKIYKALKKLDMLIVNELFDNEITKFADIVFGVKSTYEKTGIYINAERRMHLSQPLVVNDLPDDWEVIDGISKHLGFDFCYKNSKDIWNEVQKKAPKRFYGADYKKLEEKRVDGLQWPVVDDELPILHIDGFRTKDKLAVFRYKRYFLRGMIRELIENRRKEFYLTTGRVIAHYNNASQTRHCEKLLRRHDEDVLLISSEDAGYVKDKEKVVLKSHYGKSSPLKYKLTDSIKKGTLFVSFHHAKSHINFLFGDECDELTKTARFKSIKVCIE